MFGLLSLKPKQKISRRANEKRWTQNGYLKCVHVHWSSSEHCAWEPLYYNKTKERKNKATWKEWIEKSSEGKKVLLYISQRLSCSRDYGRLRVQLPDTVGEWRNIPNQTLEFMHFHLKPKLWRERARCKQNIKISQKLCKEVTRNEV